LNYTRDKPILRQLAANRLTWRRVYGVVPNPHCLSVPEISRSHL